MGSQSKFGCQPPPKSLRSQDDRQPRNWLPASEQWLRGMRLRAHWAWLLLLAPVALGLARLRFDVEVLDLLPTQLPVVRGLVLYQQHFANARELLLTVTSPQP